MERRRIRRALISVCDKTGLVEFATALVAHGVHLLSTGGTAEALRAGGVSVEDIEEYTALPSLLGGRVKTLHPRVHGAILACPQDEGHQADMRAHGIEPLDMVVVNFYAFADTHASGASEEACLEAIDVGGPTMLRAAAKNYRYVTVVSSPEVYSHVLEDMRPDASTTLALRKTLAAEAFSYMTRYDASISSWFSGQSLLVTGEGGRDLRYGENPHQKAMAYHKAGTSGGVVTAQMLQGKPLSFNNMRDADAALSLVRHVPLPAAAVVKHLNPCGAAQGADVICKAFEADSLSAFGAVVALNREVDAASARYLTEHFLDVVIAPGATEEAQHILKEKKSLRVLLTCLQKGAQDLDIYALSDGFVTQEHNTWKPRREDLSVVTTQQPTEAQWRDILFAWHIVTHVTSNAIVCVKDEVTTGIGAGQMSRVDAARLAIEKGGCGVAASDAFFPFPDAVETLLQAGVRTFIQPGGSIRDSQVVSVVEAAGGSMILTGRRCFKH